MVAQTIAAVTSAIAAVCNIVLIILLYRWYGKADPKTQNRNQPCPQQIIAEAVARQNRNQRRLEAQSAADGELLPKPQKVRF